MNIKRHALWVIPLIAIAVAAAVWLNRSQRGPRVSAVHAVRRPLVQTLVTSGRVVARRQSQLGATLQSTVDEVLVEEGDSVEADALLVHFADEEELAALAEAEAAVAEAEARLSGALGVGRRIASQSLQQARIEANLAAQEFERQSGLFAAGAISEAALSRARRDRDATRSRRVSASIEVAASSATGSDAQALTASLTRAQARLRAAEVRVERTQLRAPTAGTVLLRHVEAGEVVRPGDVLVTFAGEGPLEILIRPDESNLARLALEQPALVSPEAFPDRRLAAHVARIAPAVDPERGTIDVELTLDEAEGLRPDMTVTVEVELGRVADALVLPIELIRDFGSPAPWVLVAVDGVGVREAIELGLEGDDVVEVLEGIDESAALISPEASVMAGDAVRTRAAVPALD